MIQVEPVEIRAVVAAQGNAARQVTIGHAQQLIDQPVHGHDAQAEIVNQAQVGSERNMIVGRVVVAGDIHGMVGEDGNVHAQAWECSVWRDFYRVGR